MSASPLKRDIVEQILSAVAASVKANPDLPLTGKGGNHGAISLAIASLPQPPVLNTWRSRVRLIKEQFPGEWAEACKGTWVPPTPEKPGVRAVLTGGVRRWLLTAAQDDTPIHEPFWRNLLAYADHLGAQIIVGGFTYQKGLFEDHAARTAVFAEPVQPYMAHEKVDLGPVVFCAEMNILPTAVRPLSGLDTHTRGRWGVFPHAKIQLISVPAIEEGGAAILCTTGACTRPNYVEKKAGLKARFHHVIGATIVEVTADGTPFMRQISATEDGAFQDLDLQVANGRVTAGHRVEAITWGDIHREKIDPVVAMLAWGLDVDNDELVTRDTMIDVLRPRHQFFHDLLDFQARNHHRRHDFPFLFRMVRQGTDSVEAAIRSCARFLRVTARDYCQSVVVPSNHNDAFPRWLNEVDGRQDPPNALFWLRANTALYEAIERGERDFDVFRWALSQFDERGLSDIIFLPRNGSYVICQAQGGIENVLHGDKGPNGARGSNLNLTRVSMRLNKAHSHEAAILDGVYSAGLCGLLDQEYNEGPSSWSHTQIVTYPNSKRTLVTFRGGRWRA